MDRSPLTPAQRPGRYLGGIVRRLLLFSVLMGILFVLTTVLDAIWPPLALLIPIVAAVVLAVLVAAALTGRWPRRAGAPPEG